MDRVAKLVGAISTERTPYSVTFSADGRYLAYGDGYWYGGGHIVCLEAGRGVVARFDCAKSLPEVTGQINEIAISGLCFDRANRFLAASAWLWKHAYFPGFLFRFDGSQLTPHLNTRDDREWIRARGLGVATGVRLHGRRLVVRRTAAIAQQVCSAYPVPPEVETSGIPHHLTSARMAIVGDCVLTQFGDSLLASAPSADGTARTCAIAIPEGHQVSAITADPTGRRVITGGHGGSIAFWDRIEDEDGLPNLKLVAHQDVATSRSERRAPVGKASPTSATKAIVAACFLCDGERFAVADAAGNVGVWNHEEQVATWTVPAGSPRTMAAHPGGPWLAIGCKSAGNAAYEGRIFQYDLSLR